MRKFYFYFLTLALLMLPAFASAEEVLILNRPEERTYSTIGEIYYDLDGRPADRFTVEYSKNWGGGGEVFVAQKVNEQWVEIQTLPNLNNKWKYTTIQLDRKATQIRLYSKAGATLTKFFRNAKATMAVYLETESASVTCPNAELTQASSAVIKVSHSNMNGQLTVSSDNPNVFQPEVLNISNSGVGLWQNGFQLVVNFRPTALGVQNANITITDGTNTQVVAMQAECVKRTQTIEWLPNTDIFPEGQNIGDVAKASSGLAITYTTDNPQVIDVVNGKLVAKAAGVANITATQAGDEEWNAVSVTKKISVTKKEIQTITWTQDFTALSVGGAPLRLTPSASSKLTNFEFTVDDPTIAKVEGDILTPLSQGFTTITAYQPGNDIYAPASLVRTIRVVESGVNCLAYVVNDPNNHDLKLNQSCRFDLNKPASKLSFHLKVWTLATGNAIVNQIFADGKKEEIFRQNINSGGQERQFNDIAVKREAVAIEIGGDITYGHTVSNVLVEQLSYVELDKNAFVGETYINAPYTGSFTINYSNVNDIFGFVAKQGIVKFDGAVNGNLAPLTVQCGDYGSLNVKFSVLSENVGLVKDTIVIDGANQDLIIPVEVNVIKLNQTIDWQHDFAGAKITDTIQLAATASSSLPVTFSVGDPAVATILPDNKLIFLSEGTTSVVARQDGDGTYDAVEVVKQVTVKRIDPVISVYPTVGELIAGSLLSDVVLNGGEASVDGTFEWVEPTTILAVGDVVLKAIFRPANQAHYNVVPFDIHAKVSKVKPVITEWPTVTPIVYGDKLSASQLSGGVAPQGIQGSFGWLNPDTMLNAGVHTDTLVFTPVDNANIDTVMKVVEITVEKLEPVVTSWPTASDISYGQPLSESTLSGGMSVNVGKGIFSWRRPNKILNAGLHQDTVIYVPFDTANVKIASNLVYVRVLKAENIITWEQDLSQLSVGDTVLLNATNTANMPVNYVLDQQLEQLKINADTLFVLGRVDVTVHITAMVPETENYLVANPVMVTIGYANHTAIEEVENVEMTLYPNPVVDNLTIESASAIKMVAVYTASGVEVCMKSTDNTSVQVDFGSLPAGVYYVVVTTADGRASHTIIRR